MLVSNRPKLRSIVGEPGDFWSPNSPQLVLIQPPDPFSQTRSRRLTAYSPDFYRLYGLKENTNERKKSTTKLEAVKAKTVKTPLASTPDDELLKCPKKEWKFEQIVEDLKKDSVLNSPPLSVDSGVGENGVSDVDGFIEIPLAEEKKEQRKAKRTQHEGNKRALARLFDQLITDVYSNNKCRDSTDTFVSRRRSELNYNQLNRPYERESLFRYNSFPGELHNNLTVCRHSLSHPQIVGVEGFNRSNREFQEIEGSLLLERFSRTDLSDKSSEGISDILSTMEERLHLAGTLLIIELKEKDKLALQQQGLCEIITASLQAISQKTSYSKTSLGGGQKRDRGGNSLLQKAVIRQGGGGGSPAAGAGGRGDRRINIRDARTPPVALTENERERDKRKVKISYPPLPPPLPPPPTPPPFRGVRNMTDVGTGHVDSTVR